MSLEQRWPMQSVKFWDALVGFAVVADRNCVREPTSQSRDNLNTPGGERILGFMLGFPRRAKELLGPKKTAERRSEREPEGFRDMLYRAAAHEVIDEYLPVRERNAAHRRPDSFAAFRTLQRLCEKIRFSNFGCVGVIDRFELDHVATSLPANRLATTDRVNPSLKR